MLTAIFKRDLSLALRGAVYAPVGFFLLLLVLFVFGLGEEAIAKFAPVLALLSLLLAATLALPTLFAQDAADGTLEHYLMQPIALPWLVAVKLLVHWLTCYLPMLIITPLVFSLLHVPHACHALTVIALATPTIVAIGCLSAALTLTVTRNALVPMLVAFPLYVPALIFSAQLAINAARGDAWMLLGGLALAALPISCWVSALALRLGSD